MKEEVLNLIKDEINKAKQDRENYLMLLHKIHELEQDEKIKEYLNLRKQFQILQHKDTINKSDDEIMYDIFNKYRNIITETNQIYVYTGTFTVSESEIPYEIMVQRNDIRGIYRKYKDIENGYTQIVNIEDSIEFENNNIVLFPNTGLLISYYDKVREEYIKLVVTEGQEKAYQRILSIK